MKSFLVLCAPVCPQKYMCGRLWMIFGTHTTQRWHIVYFQVGIEGQDRHAAGVHRWILSRLGHFQGKLRQTNWSHGEHQ